MYNSPLLQRRHNAVPLGGGSSGGGSSSLHIRVLLLKRGDLAAKVYFFFVPHLCDGGGGIYRCGRRVTASFSGEQSLFQRSNSRILDNMFRAGIGMSFSQAMYTTRDWGYWHLLLLRFCPASFRRCSNIALRIF
jgi:hypothetical protein